MSFTIVSVADCKWNDEAHSSADCTVVFAEIGEPIPFCAKPDDCEAHGRLLYADIAAGKYGPVAEAPPPPPEPVNTAASGELPRSIL